jgi:WD40 repeat protein
LIDGSVIDMGPSDSDNVGKRRVPGWVLVSAGAAGSLLVVWILGITGILQALLETTPANIPQITPTSSSVEIPLLTPPDLTPTTEIPLRATQALDIEDVPTATEEPPFVNQVITSTNGSLLKPIEHIEFDGNLWDLEFSPDGQALAIGGDHGLIVIEITTHDRVVHVNEVGQYGPVERIFWSPDGEYVAVEYRSGQSVAYELASGSEVFFMKDALVLGWQPSGTLLAYCGQGRTSVWDSFTGISEQVYDEMTYGSSSCWQGQPWSPEGDTLIIANLIGGFILWNPESKDLDYLPPLIGEATDASDLAWTPNGNYFAYYNDLVSDAAAVFVHSFQGNNIAMQIGGHGFRFVDNEKILIWAGTRGWIYTIPYNQIVAAIDLTPRVIQQFEVSPKGTITAMISFVPYRVTLHAPDSFQEILNLEGQSFPIAWSLDGTRLATYDPNTAVVIWGIP